MDVYIVLGVTRSASLPDVKKAYRRLARRFHPDVNPGDDQAAIRFREIAEAYAILSDPERRQRYDHVGYEVPSADTDPSGFEGFDFSSTVHANQQSTFGDLFADIFRGAATRPLSPERGPDLHATLLLTFDQAVVGGQFRVPVVREDSCHDCAGTGLVSSATTRCPACEGSGSVRSARGHMVFSRTCERCRGSGLLVTERCPGCGGMGRLARSERVAMDVPAGIQDQARVRVAGRGHAGRLGAPPGDLYVTVHVAPHPLFRREGNDLHLVVPVSVHEAALGAKVEIPAVGGTARLRVPPGTQSGQRFRLRGRGAPSPRDGSRGDLVVELRLVLPAVLDERSKALLREFGALNGENVRQQFDEAWKPALRNASGA